MPKGINLIKNYEQLKLAMGRFVRSQKAISDLKQTVVGTETLIPLTQSMYVPAKTTSNDKLLLAIGTGYYTEKNATDAGQFFDRKLKFLKARSQELEILIRQKQQHPHDFRIVLIGRSDFQFFKFQIQGGCGE